MLLPHWSKKKHYEENYGFCLYCSLSVSYLIEICEMILGGGVTQGIFLSPHFHRWGVTHVSKELMFFSGVVFSLLACIGRVSRLILDPKAVRLSSFRHSVVSCRHALK